jgi:hypothetical protein
MSGGVQRATTMRAFTARLVHVLVAFILAAEIPGNEQSNNNQSPSAVTEVSIDAATAVVRAASIRVSARQRVHVTVDAKYCRFRCIAVIAVMFEETMSV